MKKIALDGEFSFSDKQIARLKALASIETLKETSTSDGWITAVKGYDVICTWGGPNVVNSLDKLENVLVTYPYTELGSFDSTALEKRNVYVANARGGNRTSMAEWTMFMILSLYRQFPKFLRTTDQFPITWTESLEGKSVLIIGHGTIGTEVGERCAAFGMRVDYFNRGDDLSMKASKADVVVNALNVNPSSKNLLNADFFSNMKHGGYFVSFVRPYTYDNDGLISAIDAGIVEAAAIDCDPEAIFDISNDFYKKCMSNEKILVTPHIAGITTQAVSNGLEIVVENIESYLKGTPQNILKK